MNPHYRHTQIGYVIIAGLIIIAISIISQSPGTPAEPLPYIIMGFVAVILFQFTALTVTIDNGFITASLGIGIFRRRIALADIDSFQQVRNPWYLGWGIRHIRGGWVFNVSGLDAVELRLKSGALFRIGTDEPEALAGAIKMTIGQRP